MENSIVQYPDKKDIKFLVFVGSLLSLPSIFSVLFWRFFYTNSPNEGSDNIVLIGTIFGATLLYPFLSWEYLCNKQWKPAIVMALIITGITYFYYIQPEFLFEEGYYSIKEPNMWFFIITPLLSVYSLGGLVYGFIKGDSRNAFTGFIIGSIFSVTLSIFNIRGLIPSFNIRQDESIINVALAIVVAVVIYTCLGFVYYYFLNFYSSKQKLIDSFTSNYKKHTLKETQFFMPFVLLYSTLFFCVYSIFIGLHKTAGRFIGNNLDWIFLVYIVLAILVLFLLLHSLSNLVIQKHYQLKIPIGLAYLFLFTPLINIFILIYLYRKGKSTKVNPHLLYVRNHEKFENEDYKKLIIVLNCLTYIVTLGLTIKDYSKTGLIITISFFVVNIAFLIGLYFYKYAWIGMIMSLLFLTFFRFYFKIADGSLIINSLVSGIMVLYLYVQSFHPISLDIPIPDIEKPIKTTTDSES